MDGRGIEREGREERRLVKSLKIKGRVGMIRFHKCCLNVGSGPDGNEGVLNIPLLDLEC